MLRMANSGVSRGQSSSLVRRRASKLATMKRHGVLLTTAAAAFFGHAQAFVLQPQLALRPSRSPSEAFVHRSSSSLSPYALLAATPSTTTTRLYASSPRNEEGFLEKIGDAARRVLPWNWFKSDEERKAEIERKKVRKEISGGITELLKDAPLPVRMFGGLVGPLFSSAMSGLAESMKEQQQTIDSLLEDAAAYLNGDDAVVQLLGGDPVSVGSPFSQSSSTTSINGKSTTRIDMAFPVTGRSGTPGVARLSYTDQGIQQLTVQANGRVVPVSLSSKGKKRRGGRIGGGSRDDTIIEAEIIEKDTKL